MTTSHERKYTRTPKPESKIEIIRNWYGTKDGKTHGPIPLTADRKKQFEAQGWVFKPARGKVT